MCSREKTVVVVEAGEVELTGTKVNLTMGAAVEVVAEVHSSRMMMMTAHICLDRTVNRIVMILRLLEAAGDSLSFVGDHDCGDDSASDSLQSMIHLDRPTYSLRNETC